jgi:single-strand DNA-binding protein
MAINKVILVGHLGKDPELIKVPSGTSLCKFSIATTERFKNRQGEQQEKTEWHNIIAWGGLAETCGKWLHKGKQVYIEGKLQTTSYEDDNGTRRYRTEVVANTMQMLGRAADYDGGYEKPRQLPQSGTTDSDDWGMDDVPF